MGESIENRSGVPAGVIPIAVGVATLLLTGLCALAPSESDMVAQIEQERERLKERSIHVEDRGHTSGHGKVYSFSPEPGVSCYTVVFASAVSVDCVVKSVPEAPRE